MQETRLATFHAPFLSQPDNGQVFKKELKVDTEEQQIHDTSFTLCGGVSYSLYRAFHPTALFNLSRASPSLRPLRFKHI